MRKFIIAFSMPCSEQSLRTSKAADAPLSLGERLGHAAHRAICTGCRRFAAQLRRMRARIRRAYGRVAEPGSSGRSGLSPAARDRIRTMIDSSLA